MKTKTPDEIRKEAKEKAAEINAGKRRDFSPMNRDETMVYVAAYEEGYVAALAALKK